MGDLINSIKSPIYGDLIDYLHSHYLPFSLRFSIKTNISVHNFLILVFFLLMDMDGLGTNHKTTSSWSNLTLFQDASSMSKNSESKLMRTAQFSSNRFRMESRRLKIIFIFYPKQTWGKLEQKKNAISAIRCNVSQPLKNHTSQSTILSITTYIIF